MGEVRATGEGYMHHVQELEARSLAEGLRQQWEQACCRDFAIYYME